jgi:hypothetical protein
MKQVVQLLTKVGLLVVLAMAPAIASAQTLGRIKANIPFDFSVGDQKLPAGEYSIVRAQQTSGDLVLMISSADGHARALRITNPVVTLDPKSKETLVFHRYGDEYFLSQVWTAGATTGRMFRESRDERVLRSHAKASKVVMKVGSE